jgi:hypothetical protein
MFVSGRHPKIFTISDSASQQTASLFDNLVGAGESKFKRIANHGPDRA